MIQNAALLFLRAFGLALVSPERLDRRGDRIDRRLDRKGAHVNRRH